MDAWTFVFAWWRRFGTERVLHPTAHDVLMAAPGLGDYFRLAGVIPASREGVGAALSAGGDVIIWPGGEVDGQWLANGIDRISGLKRKLRGSRLPIVLGFPIGLTIETIPTHLPLPAKIRRLELLIVIASPWTERRDRPVCRARRRLGQLRLERNHRGGPRPGWTDSRVAASRSAPPRG